jgi:hypothetical protein
MPPNGGFANDTIGSKGIMQAMFLKEMNGIELTARTRTKYKNFSL